MSDTMLFLVVSYVAIGVLFVRMWITLFLDAVSDGSLSPRLGVLYFILATVGWPLLIMGVLIGATVGVVVLLVTNDIYETQRWFEKQINRFNK